jgi:hypothetical protein
MSTLQSETEDKQRAARAKEPSWYEASARQRVRSLLDAGSFNEFIGPEQREVSPHLGLFDLPEPSLMMPGIIISFVFSEQMMLIVCTAPV